MKAIKLSPIAASIMAVYAGAGLANQATTIQVGSGNDAATTQSGSDLSGNVNQYGDGNDTWVTQTGSFNAATVNNGFAEVGDESNNTSVSVDQSGEGHFAQVDQRRVEGSGGDPYDVTVQQSGIAGHATNILQTDTNGAIATSLQSGDVEYNAAYIEQELVNGDEASVEQSGSFGYADVLQYDDADWGGPNTAGVNQSGDANDAIIEQTRSADASARIIQTGIDSPYDAGADTGDVSEIYQDAVLGSITRSEQHGGGHRSFIDQFDAETLDVTVIQTGSGHVSDVYNWSGANLNVNVNQSGTDQTAFIDQSSLGFSTEFKTVVLTQSGDRNDADIEQQSETGRQSVFLTQGGARNDADIDQWAGSDHSVTATQTGSNDELTVLQNNGNHLLAMVTQSGSHGDVDIDQSNEWNEATVEQVGDGDRNQVTVTQNGLGADAAANQAFVTQIGGTLFTATITQTGGAANYSSIHQSMAN